MKTIDRSRVAVLMDRELGSFRRRHVRSGELARDAKRSLLFGVPMNWMTRWPGDHAVFADRASGARIHDVDGNEWNGAEAGAGQDELIDAYIHLYLLNRGILITPFHNMALMSPATATADIDRHTAVFGEMAEELRSPVV